MKKYLLTNWKTAVCIAGGFGVGRLIGGTKPVEILISMAVIYLLTTITMGLITKSK